MSEAQAYAEYPLTMVHPHFQASKPIPTLVGGITDYHGTPQRLPPVTVNSVQEEEYHASQGYERAGKIDPSAWVKAHSDAPPEEYKAAKYPMWRDGVLIMSAQEDPEADAADLEQAEIEEPTPPDVVVQSSEAANMRAMLKQMNQTMQAMSQQMAEQKAEAEKTAAENAELKAMLEAATAPDQPKEAEAESERRGPGRPRKVS